MKYGKNIIAALALSLMMGASSCNDFLDVKPTGQLEESVQFNDIQGYYDALYGVYGKMATTNLYGGNLTYNFVDKLGQMYAQINPSVADNYIVKYQYTDAQVRPTVNAIWKNQYEAILYANNLIRQVDNAPFSHADLAWIKGEALGLRGFLHFDLVRLFAEDYAQVASKADKVRGIPYATTFDLNNKPLLSLKATYQAILSDLDAAEQLLSEDVEVKSETRVSANFRAGRVAHFNKYAVYATKARVYYTMGDYANAAKYAQLVVDATGNFSLVASSNVSAVRRFPASQELIFGLNNAALSQIIYDVFLKDTSTQGNAVEGRRDLAKLYETATFSATNTDKRYEAFFKQQSAMHLFTRIVANQTENESSKLGGVCLIRLPEMYYILSESLYDSNPTSAIAYYNKVRASRGLEDVDAAKVSTRSLFDAEMRNERMREFPGEGQVFYALKHYNQNFTDVTGKAITAGNDVFVLPWPESEKEYGFTWSED